jgi:hypothetical protein
MPRINLTYQEGGQAIRAIGDVFRGWQEWEKGFGYFGRGFLELRGGWRLTIDLQVRARPNERANIAKDFPRGLSAYHGSPSRYYSLEDFKLIGYCNLASHLGWLENSAKPGIYWAPETPIFWNGLVSFYVVLSIVFNQLWYSFNRDVVEKDLLPFFAGGQTESNRRRH